MREFKFRAWDDQHKLMLRDVVYMNTGHGYGKYSVVLPFKSENYFKAHGQSGWEIDGAGNAYKHNLQVMQYTGLKDKNGVEIYEGDIVKFKTKRAFKPPRVSTRIFKSVVEFEDCAFLISETQNNDCVLWCDDKNKLEVIGNIYENPELLK